MRKHALSVLTMLLGVLLVVASTGCTDLVMTNARSSVAGFFTSVVNGAINSSINK